MSKDQKEALRIVFFGSDDFAAYNLKSLIESHHDVVACVTQPDRPKGRHYHLASSPVKGIAQEAGIPVLQPLDLDDQRFIDQLKSYGADIFVVIAYGKFLSQQVLEIPKILCINAHASLLPRYRGAAPINWAILNGENKTGISIIKMNVEMDAGDILCQKTMDISPDDTSVSLRKRLIEISAEGVQQSLSLILSGDYPLIPQDDSQVSYAKKLVKATGAIDWNIPAVRIHNMVRGLLPWPTAYTFFNGKILKVLETEIGEDLLNPKPSGTVLQIDKQGIRIATKDKVLIVKRVHFQSSKPMNAWDFSIGHKLREQDMLEKN